MNFRVFPRPLLSTALPAVLTVLTALPAGAATKTVVVPYAPLFESIPRATGERFSGYLLDSLRNNDAVEMVDLPGEAAEAGGKAGATVSTKAATPEQRTAVIASYALCGFANFASIGIQLGGIGAMAPERMGELSKMAFRAMLAGAIANCMMGNVVGLFL